MKPVHRRFLAFFLPISGALLALALLLYSQLLSKKIRLAESDGRYAVELHERLLEADYRAAGSDLRFLAGARPLTDFLDRPAAASKDALARELLRFASRRDRCAGVRLLDASGRELVRVDVEGGRAGLAPERRLRTDADPASFREALALGNGKVFAAAFRPDSGVRFATPVFDGGGRRRGLLTLDYSGAAFLRGLDETAARLPGSFLLLDGAGLPLRGAADRPGVRLDIPEDAKDAVSTPEGIFVLRSFDPAAAGFETGGVPASRLRLVYEVPASRFSLKEQRGQKTLFLLCIFIEAVLAVLIAFLVRAHAAKDLHLRRIEESEARLRALSAGLIETQERERKNLSRDLHDDLGQLLTAACLELERALRPEAHADRLEVVRRALESTRAALDRMRDISSRLRPRVLDEIGLKEAVRSLLDDYSKKTGIDVREDFRFQNSDVPGEAGVNVYRILQEALTNAAKHSRTKKVLVSLGLSGGGLALSVKDWGAGFAERPSRPGSLGFLSMRERAELSGGTFGVVSAPGAGTEIRVTIPLPAAPSVRARS